MIELTSDGSIDSKVSSSKGNQLKWNENNIWYKADRNGYEGLSEYVVSELLKRSNLNKNEFVEYELEQIKNKNNIYNGCKATNFLSNGENIITLERLHQINLNTSLTNVLESFPTYKEKADYIVKFVSNITGLDNFGEYLSKVLVIDALFLNEDRHMHNIAVLVNKDKKYDYCPIFDNGACLLSDTAIDYPITGNISDMLSQVKSKTIGPDFEMAIDAIESLYGIGLSFSYTNDDIDKILSKANIYEDSILKRVKKILMYQKNKWDYFFE